MRPAWPSSSDSSWPSRATKSDGALVITTLRLAGMFTPIKNWLQGFVDRRFNLVATLTAGPSEDVELTMDQRVAILDSAWRAWRSFDLARRQLRLSGVPPPRTTPHNTAPHGRGVWERPIVAALGTGRSIERTLSGSDPAKKQGTTCFGEDSDYYERDSAWRVSRMGGPSCGRRWSRQWRRGPLWPGCPPRRPGSSWSSSLWRRSPSLYRATTGMRLALVGLILAGFVMFLASLYGCSG